MDRPTLITYWKSHYVIDVGPNDIEGATTLANCTSGGASHELVCFLTGNESPNLLVSLVGLTQSLRAEYAGSGVGFSLVSPGLGLTQKQVPGSWRTSRVMHETPVP